MPRVTVTLLRRAAILLPALGFILLTSCDGFFVSNSSIQSVTVTPSAVILQAGATPADKFTFSSSALTVGGTSTDDTSTATWKSSDNSVVTAAAGGVVTAAGTTGGQTATITATDPSGGTSGSASVLTYTGTAPTSFTLNFTLPTGVAPGAIPIGTVFPVTALASLSGNSSTNITNYVTWSITSNTAGATINTLGQVTIPATATAGNFTVQAVAQFGVNASQPTITESLTFTVI